MPHDCCVASNFLERIGRDTRHPLNIVDHLKFQRVRGVDKCFATCEIDTTLAESLDSPRSSLFFQVKSVERISRKLRFHTFTNLI